MDENSETMANEVYNAAISGDVTIFSSSLKKQNFLTSTYEKNNILHIAAQHKQNIFIKAALNNLPRPMCESLLCGQNSDGNTAIHIAAEGDYQATVEQLYEFYSVDQGGGRVMPWRLTNAEGNTPAHLALMYGNVWVARYLIEKDNCIARMVNDSKQTLLHLAMQINDHDTFEPYISQMQGPSSWKKANQLTEDLLQITKSLLKTESSIACWKDSEGSTPMHKAASFKPPHSLQVIKAILVNCPQAAEVRDEQSGQTVLHLLTNHQVPRYEDGVALLNIPQVHALRNFRNGHGDTPLHLAAINNDINMVRALLGTSPNLNIKNKDGVAAGTLVEQLCVAPIDNMGNAAIVRWEFTKEELEAVKVGDVAYMNAKIEQIGMHFLVSQTPKEGNILHVLMCCAFNTELEEFIGKVITKFPMLITQKDNNGETPLHLLAEKEDSSKFLLDLTNGVFKKAREEAGDEARDTLNCSPWRLRNTKGDTPLHAAARAGRTATATKLVEFDGEVVGYVNNRDETPLHLLSYEKDEGRLAKNIVETEDLIRSMIKENAELPRMQEVDGLTPLLAAIQKDEISLYIFLNSSYPECSKIADHKRRTLWHMFVDRPLNKEDGRQYFILDEYPQLVTECNISLLTSRDNDGNTPLHLAIANQHYGLARGLLRHLQPDDTLSLGLKDTRRKLLESENKKGVSCYKMLGEAEHLPYPFTEYLREEGNLLFGYRSLYGVPTTKINDYANTIGVVAALLMTVTFTAAFTVPGGLDASNGSPLLLQNAAFKVFIISDVVAMCLSVMVLLCMLWIMTTGHESAPIVLLDVSVVLLRASFYATLLTFMTGLYATTKQIVPGIAISTCVISSLPILIMHKAFLGSLVVPVCQFLIYLSLWLRRYSFQLFFIAGKLSYILFVTAKKIANKLFS